MLTQKGTRTRQEARQISPVTLAFLGDAVYSLYVRERLTLENNGKVSSLQRVAAKLVSAKGQSAFLDRVLPTFTEEEADVFRRGKNAKKATKSKSASNLEYSRSTGFEAVLGFLYLVGDEERIQTLMSFHEAEEYLPEAEVKPFKPTHY